MTPLWESSFVDLYDSTVDAFPNTTLRQHATQPIQVSHFKITPFLGVRTMFITARAVNEGRRYDPIILVKDMKYANGIKPGVIEIVGSDNILYHLYRPSLAENDIKVRCQCKDFSYRFNFFNYLDNSLYGRKRVKYEAKHNPGSANPLNLPGACKHLIKMAEVLHNSGIIS